MATFEEEQQIRDTATQNLMAVSGAKLESLYRDELGAELNFRDGAKVFERTLSLIRRVDPDILWDLSFNKLQALNKELIIIAQILNEVVEFSLQKHPSNPTNQRDSIITRMRDKYDQLHDVLSPIIAFSQSQSGVIENMKAKIAEVAEGATKVKAEIDRLYTEAEVITAERQKESIDILNSLRSAAAEAGVSQHSIYFKDEALENANESTKWLRAAIVIGCLTVLFGLYSLYSYSNLAENLDWAHSVHLLFGKAVVFSILYFALIWTGRNYRAYRHNAVVNKHRQNALSTFQAFVKASDQRDVKDAVLLRSTEAIFSPVATGYITKESEGQGNTQILEVLRGAIKTGQ